VVRAEPRKRHFPQSVARGFRCLVGNGNGYGNGLAISDSRNVPPEVAAKVKGIAKEVVAGKFIPEGTDTFVAP